MELALRRIHATRFLFGVAVSLAIELISLDAVAAPVAPSVADQLYHEGMACAQGDDRECALQKWRQAAKAGHLTARTDALRYTWESLDMAPPRHLRRLARWACRGDVEAMSALARVKLHRNADDLEARSLLVSARNRGSLLAATWHGTDMLTEEGNAAAAGHWLWVACDRNSAEACFELANASLRNGDDETVVWALSRLSGLGVRDADVELASYLADFWLPFRDAERAVALAEGPALAGDIRGMRALGMALALPGPLHDPKMAFEWLLRAAEAGDVEAGAHLVTVWVTGAFSDTFDDEDFELVGRWAAKLAPESGAVALFAGAMRTNSSDSEGCSIFSRWIEEDCVALLELAWSQGQTSAALALGDLYRDGDGVPRDLAVARRWYLDGLSAGDVEAGRALAAMLAASGDVQGMVELVDVLLERER